VGARGALYTLNGPEKCVFCVSFDVQASADNVILHKMVNIM
jgi:hypothetical protein